MGTAPSDAPEAIDQAIDRAIWRAVAGAVAAPDVERVIEEEGLSVPAVEIAARQVARDTLRSAGSDVWAERRRVEAAALDLFHLERELRLERIGAPPRRLVPNGLARRLRIFGFVLLLGVPVLVGDRQRIDVAFWFGPIPAATVLAAVLVVLPVIDERRFRRKVRARARLDEEWDEGRERTRWELDPTWVGRRDALRTAIDEAVAAARPELAPVWVNIAIERVRLDLAVARDSEQGWQEARAAAAWAARARELSLDRAMQQARAEERRRRLAVAVSADRLRRLADTHDLSLLETTSMRRLRSRAALHPAGATIGVAGERGVGKSGMLRWAHDTTLAARDDEAPGLGSPGLGVLLSFSTRHDALTLVTAVLSELVDRVVDTPPPGLATSEGTHLLRIFGIRARDPIERAGHRRIDQRRRAQAWDTANTLGPRLVWIAGLVALVLATQGWTIRPETAGLARAALAFLLGSSLTSLARAWRGWSVDDLEYQMIRRMPNHLLVDGPLGRGPRGELARRSTRLVGQALMTFGVAKAGATLWTISAATPPQGIERWVREGLPPGTHLPLVVALVLGCGVVALQATRYSTLSGRGTRSEDEEQALEEWLGLALDGQAILERLTYQMTSTQETSTTVQLSPFSWLVGSHTHGRSTERAEQPVTVPEAVRLFRDLCARAAQYYGHVVICIDELDKIGSAQEAELCLNDLKALFPVQRTYFVISVSTSALAAFERRGIPFRDVFDSSLDDIVVAEEFDVATTRDLVAQRVPGGLPDPFVWVVLAITGGLPRDVLRLLRELGGVEPDGSTTDLDLRHASRSLVARERQQRGQATSRVLIDHTEDSEAAGLLRRLTETPEAWTGEALAGLSRTRPITADGSVAFQGFLAYAALLDTVETLVDLMTDGAARSVPEDVAERLVGRAGPASSLDLLVRARRQLADAPQVALRHIATFRAAWGLPPLPDQATPDGAVGLPGDAATVVLPG